MKKTIVIMLVLCACISLPACSGWYNGELRDYEYVSRAERAAACGDPADYKGPLIRKKRVQEVKVVD